MQTIHFRIKTPGNAEVASSHLSGKIEEEEQKTERKLHDYVDLPPSQLGNGNSVSIDEKHCT